MYHISSQIPIDSFLTRLPRSVLLIYVICGYLLSTPVLAQSSFEKGKKWYEKRAEKADSFEARSRYINNAIHSFRDAYQEEGPSEETATFLLKCAHFKGMYTGLEEDLQKKVYNRGREFGEQAVEEFPESVPVKYWYAVNMSRWASLHGVITSAASGVAGKLRKLTNEVIAQDPAYEDGGGYRLLAKVHLYVPDIPLVLGWPSDKKALELIQQAMDIAPYNPGNRLLYAEILLEINEEQQAKKHLFYLTEEMEPRPSHKVEDRYIKHRARMLMQELNQ